MNFSRGNYDAILFFLAVLLFALIMMWMGPFMPPQHMSGK